MQVDENVISACSRAHAFAVGHLIDVTAEAKAVGLRHAVAVTKHAHSAFVAWSATDTRINKCTQQPSDRLHAVLSMLRHATHRCDASDITFQFLCMSRTLGYAKAELVRARARCMLGDFMEPTITIMTLDE